MTKIYTPNAGDLVFFETPVRGGKLTRRVGELVSAQVFDGFYDVDETIPGNAPRTIFVRPKAILGKAPKSALKGYTGGTFVPAQAVAA